MRSMRARPARRPPRRRLSLLFAVASSAWLLMYPEIAAVATILLLATCYVLVAHAARIFKKFELQHGEVVRFNDFLRALPKAQEQDEDSDSSDEERALDPKSAVL